MLKKFLSGVTLIIPFYAPASIFALEACGENSPQPGVEAVQVDESGLFKYRSTVALRVPKDNTSQLLYANKRAKIKARAGFVEFWESAELEKICSDNEEVMQNIVSENEVENINYSEITSISCSITDKVKGLVRGAEFAGDCQIGDLYYYSLAITPDSINAAIAGSNQIQTKIKLKNQTLDNQSGEKKIKFNTYDKYEF